MCRRLLTKTLKFTYFNRLWIVFNSSEYTFITSVTIISLSANSEECEKWPSANFKGVLAILPRPKKNIKYSAFWLFSVIILGRFVTTSAIIVLIYRKVYTTDKHNTIHSNTIQCTFTNLVINRKYLELEKLIEIKLLIWVHRNLYILSNFNKHVFNDYYCVQTNLRKYCKL